MSRDGAHGRVEAGGSAPTVVVDDPAQASRLHAKGWVGTLEGGRLRLHAVEAAWLAAEGRLALDGAGLPGPPGASGTPLPSGAPSPSGMPGTPGREQAVAAAPRASPRESPKAAATTAPPEASSASAMAAAAGLLAQGQGGRCEVEYLAYADLRSRGLLVRPWQGGWAVWPRGGSPQETPAYLLDVHAERDPASAGQALEWAQRHVVLGLVDEDGGVTYYRAAPARPEGGSPQGDAAGLPRLQGQVLADRVVVPSPAAGLLREREHVGIPTGAGLVLSFTEAEALRRRGVLDVPSDLAARAGRAQPHFARTLPVYEALRQAGVVAKSGFKFGTHLRGYRGDPGAGHAEWLVQCVTEGETLHWADLSRAIRLAHGVRKSFLLAVAGGGPVRFVHLSWFRP